MSRSFVCCLVGVAVVVGILSMVTIAEADHACPPLEHCDAYYANLKGKRSAVSN